MGRLLGPVLHFRHPPERPPDRPTAGHRRSGGHHRITAGRTPGRTLPTAPAAGRLPPAPPGDAQPAAGVHRFRRTPPLRRRHLPGRPGREDPGDAVRHPDGGRAAGGLPGAIAQRVQRGLRARRGDRRPRRGCGDPRRLPGHDPGRRPVLRRRSGPGVAHQRATGPQRPHRPRTRHPDRAAPVRPSGQPLAGSRLPPLRAAGHPDEPRRLDPGRRPTALAGEPHLGPARPRPGLPDHQHRAGRRPATQRVDTGRGPAPGHPGGAAARSTDVHVLHGHGRGHPGRSLDRDGRHAHRGAAGHLRGADAVGQFVGARGPALTCGCTCGLPGSRRDVPVRPEVRRTAPADRRRDGRRPGRVGGTGGGGGRRTRGRATHRVCTAVPGRRHGPGP